jgi:hypothetical protein
MRQKRTPSSIDRKLELFFAALIAVGVLLLVNLPLIYFTLLPKGGLVFLGRRVINSQDVYTYVSFIEQSKQGKYLFQNMFTSEQQSASLFRPSYLVLGKIAALFRLSSIHAYHVGRVIFSISFFVVVYCLIQQISERPKQRLLMFGVVLFSSGLGWLLGKYIGSSSDLWIPESNTFLTLAESPHFILAQTLLVSGLLLFIHYLKSRDRRALAGLFLLTLVLAFEHPFDLLILGPVIFCLRERAVWLCRLHIDLNYSFYRLVCRFIQNAMQRKSISRGDSNVCLFDKRVGHQKMITYDVLF